MEPFITIYQYAKGELNTVQIDNTWSYILAEPELLNDLKTMVALFAHFSQIKTGSHDLISKVIHQNIKIESAWEHG